MLFKIWGFHISSVIWSSCCLTRISVTKHVSEFQCNLSYSVPYGLTSPHTKLSPNTAACLSCRISHLPFTSASALHCYLLFQSLYHPNVPPGAPVVMFIHTQLLCVSYLLRVMNSELRCQNCNKLFQMLRGFLNFIYLCHKCCGCVKWIIDTKEYFLLWLHKAGNCSGPLRSYLLHVNWF